LKNNSIEKQIKGGSLSYDVEILKKNYVINNKSIDKTRIYSVDKMNQKILNKIVEFDKVEVGNYSEEYIYLLDPLKVEDITTIFLEKEYHRKGNLYYIKQISGRGVRFLVYVSHYNTSGVYGNTIKYPKYDEILQKFLDIEIENENGKKIKDYFDSERNEKKKPEDFEEKLQIWIRYLEHGQTAVEHGQTAVTNDNVLL